MSEPAPPPLSAPPAWPAIIVDGLAAGRCVLEVATGRPVILLSAPGILALSGAGWWAALIGEWRQAAREAPFLPLADMADQPGDVLAALRAGIKHLVFKPTGTHPDIAGRLAGIAAAQDARLYSRPTHVLEPCWRRNGDASVRQWLRQRLEIQRL